MDMNNYPDDSATTDRDEARRDTVDRDMSRHEYPDQLDSNSESQAQYEHCPDSNKPLPVQTTPNDMSQRNAADRGEPRQHATERDTSWSVSSSEANFAITEAEDTQLHSEREPSDADNHYVKEPVPADDDNWIDIEQVALRLQGQGVPRTIRTIQRMCKREALNCRLVPTENGVRYLVTENSIDEFVVKHNQTMPTGNSTIHNIGSDTSDGSNPYPVDPAQQSELKSQSNASGPETAVNTHKTNSPTSNEGHLREIVALKDEQINLLKSQLDTANTQITVKDEQIMANSERDHETNVLLQNLQNLVGQLPALEVPNPRQNPLDIYTHRQTDGHMPKSN